MILFSSEIFVVLFLWLRHLLVTSLSAVVFKVYESIHFLNLHDNLINLSPVSLKLNQLENLTTVLKVNDRLMFWPVSREQNISRI